jgi:hypothetical protein
VNGIDVLVGFGKKIINSGGFIGLQEFYPGGGLRDE